MKSAVENTRTRPGRRMSQRKGRLKPSQMRRNNSKRRRTKRRPMRKRSLKPTALKRRPERRPRQSPRPPKRRRRRLLKAPGRALASLVALSVALLRRLRRRNRQRRRPRVGRSDALCSAIMFCYTHSVIDSYFHSCISSRSCTTFRVSLSFCKTRVPLDIGRRTGDMPRVFSTRTVDDLDWV